MLKRFFTDSYFLTESDPFSQKRKINTKSVLIVIGFAATVAVVAILVVGGVNERREVQRPATDAAAADRAKSLGQAPARDGQAGSTVLGQGGGPGGFYSDYTTLGTGRSGPSGGSGRQYTASQLVRTGDGLGGSSGDKLPIGTTFELKLLNRVLSSDSTAPVIAQVTSDVVWKDSVVIPEGTRAIGQATLDDVSERLQVRFSTLVFPEGQQRAVSGLGLLGDGSSGLPGDYHSGETKKEVASFISTFIGGVAEGMQDRQSAGELGITFAPGSIRNGLLNGVGQSAMNQGKLAAENLGKVKPYLDVPSGATFLLYLEREF